MVSGMHNDNIWSIWLCTSREHSTCSLKPSECTSFEKLFSRLQSLFSSPCIYLLIKDVRSFIVFQDSVLICCSPIARKRFRWDWRSCRSLSFVSFKSVLEKKCLGKKVETTQTIPFDFGFFCLVSDDKKLQQLGSLMDESHASCSKLYECRFVQFSPAIQRAKVHLLSIWSTLLCSVKKLPFLWSAFPLLPGLENHT